MKVNKKAEKIARFYNTFASLGFSIEETETLRRAELTLHRWFECECNGQIERCDITQKTFAVWQGTTSTRRVRCADKETGALKRIEKIMSAHPMLKSYIQTDPRGCALYILRPQDVPEGADSSAYYSRGIAVCI